MKIGFIGQGWIGKHYADDFEARGYEVIRYALEEPYVANKEYIQECDIVFIAVPTPTTPEGFDSSLLSDVLPLVGKEKTAVIKSTVLPGTTEALQRQFPEIHLIHSPEFLREAHAEYDAANPERNIIGVTDVSEGKGEEVLQILPDAPYERVVPVREAEVIKYGGNIFLYMKVLYANMMYDLSSALEMEYETVKDAIAYDPRIGGSHLNPVHDSGRGAGGHCFIKDFEAFLELYKKHVGEDSEGIHALEALRNKNVKLLADSNKDIDLLEGIYGVGKFS